jgi:hypothetical protein
MRQSTIMKAVFAASFSLGYADIVSASTIYQDQFSSSSATTTPLSGRTPDTHDSSSYTVGNTLATWTAGGGFVVAATPGGSSSIPAGAAYLPFTPAAGYIYDLQVTLTGTSGTGGNRISMGYFGSAVSTGGDAATTANSASILDYPGGVNPDQLYLPSGGGVEESNPNGVADSTQTFDLILNTMGASWTLQAELNGTKFSTGNAYTFATNPVSTIGFVGISAYNATGAVSSFQLTQTPEPTSAALLACAAPLLLRRRLPNR